MKIIALKSELPLKSLPTTSDQPGNWRMDTASEKTHVPATMLTRRSSQIKYKKINST
jgi:hypothetical protein